MLGASQPSSSGSGSSSAILGGGSRKRGFQQEPAIPSASSNGQGYGRSSSGLGQFRPRGQQQGKGGAAGDSKGKGKGKEELLAADKDSAPSYKRYGYMDRASMRRAGLLERTDGPAPSFDLDQDLVTRGAAPSFLRGIIIPLRLTRTTALSPCRTLYQTTGLQSRQRPKRRSSASSKKLNERCRALPTQRRAGRLSKPRKRKNALALLRTLQQRRSRSGPGSICCVTCRQRWRPRAAEPSPT